MKRVAIYARVSTKQQTTETQLDELRKVCEQNEWKVVSEFVDEGISGAKGRDKRPGLDKMMQGIVRKDFELVVVWSLDRLGRSVQHLINLLSDMREKGVDVYSHKQGIDTTTTTGRMMFQFLSIFADFEREMIRERVIAGQQRARMRGVKLGRRPISKEKVEAILELRRDGMGMNRIAKTLGVGSSQVHRVCNEIGV